jgi:hypothetical protein
MIKLLKHLTFFVINSIALLTILFLGFVFYLEFVIFALNY